MAAAPKPKPPTKPAFVPVSVPSADELGIGLTAAVDLPPPDALDIHVK